MLEDECFVPSVAMRLFSQHMVRELVWQTCAEYERKRAASGPKVNANTTQSVPYAPDLGEQCLPMQGWRDPDNSLLRVVVDFCRAVADMVLVGSG